MKICIIMLVLRFPSQPFPKLPSLWEACFIRSVINLIIWLDAILLAYSVYIFTYVKRTGLSSQLKKISKEGYPLTINNVVLLRVGSSYPHGNMLCWKNKGQNTFWKTTEKIIWLQYLHSHPWMFYQVRGWKQDFESKKRWLRDIAHMCISLLALTWRG